MRKILCSTGALFLRTTPEKYAALGDMADKLNCDIYSSEKESWILIEQDTDTYNTGTKRYSIQTN